MISEACQCLRTRWQHVHPVAPLPSPASSTQMPMAERCLRSQQSGDYQDCWLDLSKTDQISIGAWCTANFWLWPSNNIFGCMKVHYPPRRLTTRAHTVCIVAAAVEQAPNKRLSLRRTRYLCYAPRPVQSRDSASREAFCPPDPVPALDSDRDADQNPKPGPLNDAGGQRAAALPQRLRRARQQVLLRQPAQADGVRHGP